MENQIPETEQWQLEGDCDKCRKQKYCSKECGAFKKEYNKALNEMYQKLLEKWEAKKNEQKDNSNNTNTTDNADSV